ncbi:aldo/keto reductase [Spelaeicoccus albus]|uniref:2,5-diketo-D-gluconate reductase A n=1 Tax=Spelaeicoccus albus TaxID=1280376 RepID=A0A7Z0ACE3_9MICO|nr:aldo/keto reductase [Spelaeicoccus albus]NYI67153.1 2,5-diketo-D-gluconate reductase A [Spelaeicoccus albus]
MGAVPRLTFNDGHTIPQLGYGVWQVDDDVASDVVGQALRAGYRHIDTAQGYGNEGGVGRALAAAADAGIAQDDVFVTTKLWNADQGYDATMRAFDASMERLGIETLDLFLIHWPTPARDLYVDTFRAFIELREQGRIKSIGVSNFTIDHLTRLIDETGVTPAINQIELHPRFNQPELRAFHAEHGILTEAWSPLGQNHAIWQHDLADVPALEDPVISDIAARHDASPAQVIIAWHLALGNVVIPKSVTPARIVENFAASGISLSESDIAAVTGLHTGERIGRDPATAEHGY